MTAPAPNPAAAAPAPDGPAAFADLFAASYGRLWSLAAALVGDRSEAEDLVQEAAMVGLDKFRRFEPGTNFTAWMAQIVRFQASNYRSKQARRKTQATDPVDIDRQNLDAPAQEEPELREAAAGTVGALGERFDDAVVAALGDLAETARACLLLRVVHDLAYEQIAEMLGIPPGTAMSHVHRSRSRLRKQLAGTEAETHG